MRRWLVYALALLVALVGVVFSAINADPARLDLYAGSVELPLGVLVIASMLGGCLLGGAVLYFGVILPLRMRLAAARRDAARLAAAAAPPATTPTAATPAAR